MEQDRRQAAKTSKIHLHRAFVSTFQSELEKQDEGNSKWGPLGGSCVTKVGARWDLGQLI
jgi:hypothetical protein